MLGIFFDLFADLAHVELIQTKQGEIEARLGEGTALLDPRGFAA